MRAEGELEELEASIWRRWEEALLNRYHPYRLLTVSTIGAGGAPRARVVILRDVDSIQRLLSFHTDARSSKVAEIEADARISLLTWGEEDRVQLRAEGEASLWRTSSAEGAAIFSKLSEEARNAYRSAVAAGRPIDHPDAAQPERVSERDPARQNFVLVRCVIQRLEWLQLQDGQQNRAEFLYSERGAIRRWIAP